MVSRQKTGSARKRSAENRLGSVKSPVLPMKKHSSIR
jgi:hypothetical protein